MPVEDSGDSAASEALSAVDPPSEQAVETDMAHVAARELSSLRLRVEPLLEDLQMEMPGLSTVGKQEGSSSQHGAEMAAGQHPAALVALGIPNRTHA